VVNILSSFSGFSVDNLDKAKHFYSETLGFELENKYGGVNIKLSSNNTVWMYPKADHLPATYTMIDLVIENIDESVDELIKKGVVFEHYEGSLQDEKGIMRGKELNKGPNIAWFKDPAGNILAVLEA
jgi:catechol 2,3-dioxygenase-like lactoylglutathione lyase family enzyme